MELVAAGNLVTDDEILRLAASAEAGSEHPLARAVIDAAKERGPEVTAIPQVPLISG